MTGSEPRSGERPEGSHPASPAPPGTVSPVDETRLDTSRMPLREHLEELRRCLIRSFIVFLVLFIAGFVFREFLVDIILKPYEWARQNMIDAGDPDPGNLVIIKPAEKFIFTMKVAGCTAFLGGAPYFLYQVWSFVGAGLLDRERKAIFKAFPFAVGLFAAGLVFGFTVLLQLAYPFLLSFLSDDVAEVSITLSEYFSSLRSLTLLMGIVFELPVVMWLVVRAGLVQYETLRTSRRMAIIGTLVFAAIMTPPDVVTQVLVAIPMGILYEVGLLLSRRAERQRVARTGV